MTGEISHIIYAARLIDHLKSEVNDPSYWLGTLFPNIRHLNVAVRYTTHPHAVTLTSLKGKDDFHTGMRVHAWIDATRDYYLQQHRVNQTLPWHPLTQHALSLVEDEILYEYFEDWNLIHRVLNTVNPNELHYVQSREKILTWHSILQEYFSEKPTDKSRYLLATSLGLSNAMAKEINAVVNQLKNNKKTSALLQSFLEQLERILA